MSYNLLKGKKGIIFGALNEESIAWKVAERAHEEGAEFILSNAPVALRMGELNKLAEATGSVVVAADVTNMEDLENLFAIAEEKFGKLDFILHSIGMSINVRKRFTIPMLIMITIIKHWIFQQCLFIEL
jgi:enoyl-[acyl-carrier protein] reductase I